MLLYQNTKKTINSRNVFKKLLLYKLMLKSRFHKTFVKFQNRENFQQKYTWLWTDIKIDNLWSRAYFLLHSSTKLSFLSTLFITSLTFLSSHCTTSGCFQQAWHRPMYKPISCLRAAVWLKKPINNYSFLSQFFQTLCYE